MSYDAHDDLRLDADPLLDELRAARPTTTTPADDAPDAPEARALLAGILASTTSVAAHRRSRTRRVRITAGALSAAAAITVAVIAVNSVGVDNGRVFVQQQPAAADVVAIARASASAFSSGRAEMTFAAQQGRAPAEIGTAVIAFSGQNLDVAMHFDGRRGDRGYDARNKTVAGQYYLLDGAPGAQKWYHDTTATPTGTDIFDLDPRGLLAVLRPSAAFVLVGTESTPAGPVRHLRATHLGDLPSLHLVLGPVAGRDITSLDLWVGSDDTVQRLTLAATRTETPEPACFTQGGVKQCAKPGDKLAKVGGRVVIVPGGNPDAPVTPITTTASFSVRFTDIGTPIAITAPPNAIEVAGKG